MEPGTLDHQYSVTDIAPMIFEHCFLLLSILQFGYWFHVMEALLLHYPVPVC